MSVHAYITNVSDNSVSVIDVDTNSVIAVIPVGGVPLGVAIYPDGSKVYISNEADNTVSVIDTINNAVIATINVGVNPSGIAASPDGTRVYVANEQDDTLSVIDAKTNVLLTNISVGDNPYGVAIKSDNSRVYVTNEASNTVSVLDTASSNVISTISVSGSPSGIAITPDGSKLYTTNQSGDNVSVIDTGTSTVINSISVGVTPIDVAIAPNGLRAYVSNQSSGMLSVIDTATNVVIDTLNLDTCIAGVSVTPDNKKVYVANQSNNDVTVVNAETIQVITTITVGNTPFAFGDFIGCTYSQIVPAILDAGRVGVHYNQALTKTGSSNVRWSIITGRLPEGVSLNSDTGDISGTPLEYGEYTVKIKATDAESCSVTQNFTLDIACEQIKIITKSSLPRGSVGIPYSITIATEGGIKPFIWSIISGALPPGLILGIDGTIYGVPTNAGDYLFTLNVISQNQCSSSSSISGEHGQLIAAASREFVIVIDNASFAKTNLNANALYDWSVVNSQHNVKLTLS